eukprot:TRINITY_DN12556_c0_g1_i1.p1 TRINITY_DN12556_c0_g1~~TRINITY_DN12556_c0_g1_i1.p1  ORF type:complete len:335 (+),score=43.77 TRINITY_DN12556_c0_g1_i1:50-1054(+)
MMAAAILPNASFTDLLLAAPHLEVQVSLALIHAIFWAVFIRVMSKLFFVDFLYGLKNKQHFLKNGRATVKKNFMLDLGDVEEFQVEFLADFMAIVLQHGVGGLLCVPSVCGLAGYLPDGVAFALARHGGLCEVGWEIQDSITRLLEVAFGGARGREKNPPSFLLALALHHTCALCLVLPLNIYHPDNTYYHEGIMLLQLAAFVAVVAQFYGWTLDMKSFQDLQLMRLSVCVSCAMLLWSRLVRYSYVWYVLLSTFLAEANLFLLKLATPSVICMTLFNVAVIQDAVSKCLKLMNMTLDGDDHGGTRSLKVSSQEPTAAAPMLLGASKRAPRKQC